MNDRTKIATQLLASVLIQDGVLCAHGGKLWDDERCVNRAITLADLLLAKLGEGESEPAKSAPSKMDWRPFSIIKPGESCCCWVIEWDCVEGCIKNAWLATWTGRGWENVMGAELFIGGRDIEIYWQPISAFKNVDEARVDFMGTAD